MVNNIEMIGLIILFSILLLLTGLFFTPALLVVDTLHSIYHITIRGYLKAELNTAQDFKSIRIKIFFIPLKIRIKNKSGLPVKAEKRRKKTRRKKRITLKRAIDALTDIVRSIKLKKLYADIDTGNFPLNAQLIPLCQLFQNENHQMHINFENRNQLEIQAQTQLYKILWIGLKTFLFTK